MNKFILAFCIVICVLSFNVSGWSGKTHRIISDKAIDNSVLVKNYDLIYQFGFTYPWITVFKLGNESLTFRECVGMGCEKEDSASSFGAIGARSDNHFHNPLLQFDQAYLSDTELTNGFPLSSILWAHNQTKQADYVEGDNSWQFARIEFFNGLVSSEKDDRIIHFSKMFKALGHLIHLIQDMAVPDHVRNDSHVYNSFPWETFAKKHGAYRCIEGWALHNENKIEEYSDACEMPDDALLKSAAVESPSPYVLRPIANLIDSNVFDSSGYLENGAAAGLSEYTNSNYVSEDTMPWMNNNPKHTFTYPRMQSLKKMKVLTNFGQNFQYYAKYYSKTDEEGEAIPHFLRRDALWAKIPEGTGFTDANCFEDYVSKLIPKAVGYSAALLNYFFRPKLEIELPDDGIYSFADQINPTFKRISLKIRNVSPEETLDLPRHLTLIVRYREATGGPLDFEMSPNFNPEDEEKYIISNSELNLPAEKSQLVNFSFEKGLPINAIDVSFLVVCQAKLGAENGSIVFGYRKVCEPTPITILNNSDRICYNGKLVKNDDPELISALDNDNNGVVECRTGEYSVNPYALIIRKISFDGTAAETSQKSFMIDPTIVLDHGQGYTIYILCDQDEFSISVYETAIDLVEPTCVAISFKNEIFTFDPYTNCMKWIFNNEWGIYMYRSSTRKIRENRVFNSIIYNDYIPKGCTCDYNYMPFVSINGKGGAGVMMEKSKWGKVFRRVATKKEDMIGQNVP